jgi:type VI secretion system protein ImpG
MFTDYYQKELRLLRESAVDFAGRNPGLAGLLKESSTDPDTERLLEGFAFLTASIHRELDEQFPTFLYSLAQVVCPDYLRPMPSATLMAFEPKVNLNQTLRVPSETYIDSRPVMTESMRHEGRPAESCRFRTCLPVDVMPMHLTGAGYLDDEGVSGQGSRTARFKLDFEVFNTTLNDLRCDRLRLFLSGGFNEAADLYFLLNRYVSSIQVRTGANGRQVTKLEPSAVTPLGFGPDETLYQRTRTELPAFALLQEYFLFPEKYLFVDIDLTSWRDRGEGNTFSLVFETEVPDFPLPPVSTDHFQLHTTPAINLFLAETEPVLVDHSDHEIRLVARSDNRAPLPIFSVDRAESMARGRRTNRQFQPMGEFNLQKNALARFMMSFRISETSEFMDTYVSLAFPPSDPPSDREVFKAQVTCFNDMLPTALEPGDINQATMTTPELVTFHNLTIPTRGTRPMLRTDALWHLLSDLSLNFMSLASADTLKTLLGHYIPSDNDDERRYIANRKRVDAITSVRVEPQETLYRQSFLRGQSIRVVVRSDFFSGEGDRYLFGCLLDHLFAGSAGLNTFTQLVMEDSVSGAELEWPIRLGLQTLI